LRWTAILDTSLDRADGRILAHCHRRPYALNQDTDVNVSWAMVWLGDMPVEQTKSVSGNQLSGQFDNAWIQALTGNMTWRF